MTRKQVCNFVRFRKMQMLQVLEGKNNLRKYIFLQNYKKVFIAFNWTKCLTKRHLDLEIISQVCYNHLPIQMSINTQ